MIEQNLCWVISLGNLLYLKSLEWLSGFILNDNIIILVNLKCKVYHKLLHYTKTKPSFHTKLVKELACRWFKADS